MEFFIYYSEFVARAFEDYYLKLLLCWYALFAFGWVFLKVPITPRIAVSPVVQASVLMAVAVCIPFPFLFSSWLTGDLVIPR